MFTPEQRNRLRADLLEHAARDTRITGAAVTGSAASDSEDQWSDIDLAFGLADDADRSAALSDWTGYMYESHRALHHLDMAAGGWIYRVFLLPGTLQVDLAFVHSAEFRPLAPTFRLVFGTANELRPFPPPVPEGIVGLGWLYAVHARTCLARGHLWQAEHMVSALRNHALTLACLRHCLPTAHARGIDRLPKEVSGPFGETLVRDLNQAELARAFRATLRAFRTEVGRADPALADRLTETLNSL